MPAGFHSRSRGHGVNCSIRGSRLEYHENDGEGAAASTDQLGNPQADGKLPTRVDGKLVKSFMEEIACGAYHVVVLTLRTEVTPGSNNEKREQNERI